MTENKVSNLENSFEILDEDNMLLDFMQVIADNLRLLILGPLIFGLAALGISFTITPIFTAKTQILPPQQQSSAASMLASLGALGGFAAASSGLKSPTDQYVSFLKSLSIQDALIDRFKLIEKFETKFKSDARMALVRNVRISSGRDGLISIEVDDKDPKFAAELANSYVDELRKLLGKLALTEAQQRRLFFEKQLELTKENLAKADLALKSSGVNASILKSSPSSAVEVVAKLKAGISVQEVKLGAMRNYLTENSAELKQALSELTSLKIQLAKSEKDEPYMQGASDYMVRFREFKYQETMFELFAKQFELAKLDESREGGVIQVLDVAEAPEKKSSPNKAQIAIRSAFISLIALFVFVFVRMVYKNALKNEQTYTRVKALKFSLFKSIRGKS